jgi:hypothetical protein
MALDTVARDPRITLDGGDGGHPARGWRRAGAAIIRDRLRSESSWPVAAPWQWRQRNRAAACGARRIAEREALARLCGSSATLEAVGKRMRRSKCGKKGAEVVAVARPRPRGGGR